jgi:hypothetical protein
MACGRNKKQYNYHFDVISSTPVEILHISSTFFNQLELPHAKLFMGLAFLAFRFCKLVGKVKIASLSLWPTSFLDAKVRATAALCYITRYRGLDRLFQKFYKSIQKHYNFRRIVLRFSSLVFAIF